jgi:predicted secreted protein
MDELKAPENLSVTKGERFSVELRNYPGSGALWDFVLPEGIEFIEKTSKQLGEGIGGEGLQVFTFRSDTPGSHSLFFPLKRPSESIERRRKVITVQVE